MDISMLETDIVEALKIDPNNDELLCKLASVMIEKRENKKALEILNRTLECCKNYKVLNNIGYFYLTIGESSCGKWFYQFEKAVQMLSESVLLKSDSYISLSALGLAYLKVNNYSLAERMLKRAVNLRSTRVNLNNLGVAYYNLFKYAEASDYFKKSLELKSDNNIDKLKIMTNLSYCLVKLNEFDEAVCIAKEIQSELNDGLDDGVCILDLVYIFFLCSDFNTVISLFELAKKMQIFEIKPLDFFIYAFSLKSVNRSEDINKTYEILLQDNNNRMTDIKKDLDFDAKDIEFLTKQIKDENKLYEQYFNSIVKGNKPYFEVKPFVLTECYFMGCVRHNVAY